MKKISAALAAALLLSSSPALAGPRQDLAELAAVVEGMGRVEDADLIRASVEAVSDAELGVALGATAEEIPVLTQALRDAQALGVLAPSPVVQPRSGSLTAPGYSATCGSTRVATSTLQPLLIAFEVARGILQAAQRGCNQVTIAIGAGGSFSAVCIAFDIALSVASSAWEDVNFCVLDIDSAETKSNYDDLLHLHGDLEAIQAKANAIQAKATAVGVKIAQLQGGLDLVSKTQLEESLHGLGGSRAFIMYTDRIDEACNAAQEAIDDARALNYVVPTGADAYLAFARTLIPTDPKKAYEGCRRVYRMAATQSSRMGP